MKKLITLMALLFLSACSSTPDPTHVALTLNASADLNPDHVDRPSPLVVKVIEISSVTSFENAEFFDLYNNAFINEALMAKLCASITSDEYFEICTNRYTNTKNLN